MESASIGKLSVAWGNSYNLFKPQFPPLSRQVRMPPSWGCGGGDTRGHAWKHVGGQKPPFTDWFSIQQADVPMLLTCQAPRVGQSHGQRGKPGLSPTLLNAHLHLQSPGLFLNSPGWVSLYPPPGRLRPHSRAFHRCCVVLNGFQSPLEEKHITVMLGMKPASLSGGSHFRFPPPRFPPLPPRSGCSLCPPAAPGFRHQGLHSVSPPSPELLPPASSIRGVTYYPIPHDLGRLAALSPALGLTWTLASCSLFSFSLVWVRFRVALL